MKRIVTFFIIAAVLILARSACLFAGSENEIFFKASRQYDDGDFKEAIKLYERLIDQGTASGNIYYNLGNAYYKIGEKGRALLNYERAKRLMPNNEALFANISFVKSVLDTKQPKEAYPWYQRAWLSIRDTVSLKVWFFVFVIFFSCACLVLGMGFLNYKFQKRSHMISGILAFFFIISLAFFLDGYNVSKHLKAGIIVTKEADVRYSPSYSGVVAFKLTEGMGAQIMRKQGPWTHIRLNRDKSGWIESDAIEAI